MNHGLSSNTIEKLIEIFKTIPCINEAIIFGSRAIGNNGAGSDIDITLKGDISFNNLLKIEMQIDEISLPYKIDIIIFNKIKSKELVNHINRVGQIIYINPKTKE